MGERIPGSRTRPDTCAALTTFPSAFPHLALHFLITLYPATRTPTLLGPARNHLHPNRSYAATAEGVLRPPSHWSAISGQVCQAFECPRVLIFQRDEGLSDIPVGVSRGLLVQGRPRGMPPGQAGTVEIASSECSLTYGISTLKHRYCTFMHGPPVRIPELTFSRPDIAILPYGQWDI